MLISIDLDEKDKKKVRFNYYELNKDTPLTFIYDTGADMPLWCRDENILKSKFNLSGKDRSPITVDLEGVGGKEYQCPIWIVPELILRDSSNNEKYIKLLNVPVAVAPIKVGVDLIISNTLFPNCPITIKNGEVPNKLVIDANKSIYAVRLNELKELEVYIVDMINDK